MFKATGTLVSSFHTPAREKYPEKWSIQMLGDIYTKEGEIRRELVTLSVPQDVFQQCKQREGEKVSLPVGIFIQSGKLVVFYAGIKAPAEGGTPVPA